MKIVSDTSPLLFLAKINRLLFLKDMEVYLPSEVIPEIKAGKNKGHPDYLLIEKMIGQLKITIMTTPLLPDLPSNLGAGESASISLAVNTHIKHIFIDEARGRKVARLYGLKPRGTLGIAIDQYHQKKIPKKECRELIFELVRIGYRISEEILVQLLKELD